MNQGILLMLAIVFTALATSGIWWWLRRQGSLPSISVPPLDDSVADTQARLHAIPLWSTILAHFQAHLTQSTTLEEMVHGFKRVLTQEGIPVTLLIAISPLRDFAMLNSHGKHPPTLELNSQ